MENSRDMESKAAPGDDAMSSPGPEAPVAAAAGSAGGEAAASTSPPAPAAAASARPYYECVFCKRGFTTAQALGGHMNIHRRDRGKPARDPPAGGATSVSRHVECYNKYRHLAIYPTYPAAAASTPTTTTPTAAGGSSSSSFGMPYYAAADAAAAAGLEAEGVSPSSVSPRELSLFGAANRDHDLHLGLGRHGRIRDGSRTPPPEGSSSERLPGEPERELDLELRLGRRPRH
ncbi:hypothetical protein ACP70R_032035 [Stipagrostis hirtigluma subsp. patula]